MSDDLDLSRRVLERIDQGFRENQESFSNIRSDIEKIATEVTQLKLEIGLLRGNVDAVSATTAEARADVEKLERKMAELEAKAKELELAVEVAKSATPRHLPERVAVIENSLSSVKRFGWFMVTAFTGLAVKALWDLMRVAG